MARQVRTRTFWKLLNSPRWLSGQADSKLGLLTTRLRGALPVAWGVSQRGHQVSRAGSPRSDVLGKKSSKRNDRNGETSSELVQTAEVTKSTPNTRRCSGSFSLLCSIPSCEQAKVYFSILVSTDILVIYSFFFNYKCYCHTPP